MWFQSMLLDIFKKKKKIMLLDAFKISIVTLLPHGQTIKKFFWWLLFEST